MAKTRKKKNSRLIFWVQLVIAIILIGTISGGLLQVGGGDRGSSAAPDFPPWIAGLKIMDYKSGEDAKGRMNTLSEETTALRDAWIGYYEQNAVVWIGQATSESEADRLVKAMRKKTQDAISTTPELTFQESNKKGLSVNVIKVREQESEYFYQKRDKVFWVTLPPGKEEPFINEVVERLN